MNFFFRQLHKYIREKLFNFMFLNRVRNLKILFLSFGKHANLQIQKVNVLKKPEKENYILYYAFLYERSIVDNI